MCTDWYKARVKIMQSAGNEMARACALDHVADTKQWWHHFHPNYLRAHAEMALSSPFSFSSK